MRQKDESGEKCPRVSVSTQSAAEAVPIHRKPVVQTSTHADQGYSTGACSHSTPEEASGQRERRQVSNTVRTGTKEDSEVVE